MYISNKINTYPSISFKKGLLITDDKSFKNPNDIKYGQHHFIPTGSEIDDIDFEEYYPICNKDLLKKAVIYLAKEGNIGKIDLSKSRCIPKNYAATRFGNVDYSNIQDENETTKSLYHFFKKNTLRSGAFRNTDLADKIYCFKSKSKKIGYLPLIFIDNIGKKEIGNVTKEVQSHFENFASDIRDVLGEKVYSDDTSKYDDAIKKLEQKLSKTIGKKIDISYESEGRFGIAFKIECEKEKFALKIHKKINGYSDACLEDGHACEVANAVYMNEISPSNKCSKFYCASFEDGYMLTGFKDGEDTDDLNKDIEEREKIYSNNPWETANIKNPDITTKGNKIGKAVVDFGEISFRFRNKSDAKYARLLFPLIENRKKDDVIRFIEKHKNDEGYINFINYFFWTNKIPTSYNSIELRDFIASQSHNCSKKFTRDDIEYLELLGADFSERKNRDLYNDYETKFSELFL